MSTFFAIIIIILLCVISSLCCISARKPKNFPPGPKWYPVVGSFLQFKNVIKSCGDVAVAMDTLSKQYKSNVIGLKLGNHNVVLVCSYKLIREVLLDANYSSRPDNFFSRLRSMGKIRGISMASGELWITQRNFVVKHLRNVGLGKKIMECKIQNEVQELIKSIELNSSNVDFSELLSASILNVLWFLVAGTPLSKEDGRVNKLLKLLYKRTLAFDISGSTLTHFPWLRFVAAERLGYNLIKNINLELERFLKETINEHIDTWTEGRSDDLIYAYISEIKHNNGTSTIFSYDQLLIVCLDLFIAGATTTSSTINFSFLAMVLNPNIQTKVQTSLDDAFNPNKPLEYSNRQIVPYVEAAIMEVERYYLIIPVIGPRSSQEEGTLAGYTIPKGTTMFLSVNSIYTDPDHFEDPGAFRPERFLAKDGQLISSNKFFPFAIGKRKCLADTLAKTCIFIFFAEVLRKYKIFPLCGTTIKQEKMVSGLSRTPQKYSVQLVKRF